MTQDEKWILKNDEVMTLVETNKWNPLDMLLWKEGSVAIFLHPFGSKPASWCACVP